MTHHQPESELTYQLIKVKSPLATTDAYRAVTNHKPLSADETLAEIAARTGLDPARLKYYGGSILDAMAQGVIADGRSRRFGDWLEMRLDLGGKFTRIDEEFDPDRHHLTIGVVPKAALCAHTRHAVPVNVRKRPRGRIDYVTWPGGEKGELKYGADILIYGHDLTMQSIDSVDLNFYDADGRRHEYSATLRDTPPRILEHDDTHVRCRWFEHIQPADIVGRKAVVFFNPWTRNPASATGRGSSSQVIVLAP